MVVPAKKVDEDATVGEVFLVPQVTTVFQVLEDHRVCGDLPVILA